MLAASRCALAIMLSITTKVTRNHLWFELHLESTVSHNSCSDILALWGPRKRPSWLKTRSTGADVHGVQKHFPKVASSMQIACYSSQDGWRRQGIPASVPSSISWINARYEATTVGREMWITYNAVCIIIHEGLENIETFVKTKIKTKTFISRPRPFFMSLRSLEIKTKVSRLHLWQKTYMTRSSVVTDTSLDDRLLLS